MKHALTLATLLATLAGPALAQTYAPPTGESCPTLAQSVADAKTNAAMHRVRLLLLDGDQAHRFLASLAPPGSPFQLAADHVGVFFDPATNGSFIVAADNACGGYASSLRVAVPALRSALEASQR